MIPAASQGTPLSDSDVLPTAASRASADSPLVEWSHDAVLKMTAEVFPGATIEFGRATDPEIEGDEYFVVAVKAPGEVMELVARDREWHRRLRAIAAHTTRFYRLLLEVA
jgi:hypothetical protein